MIKWHFSEFFKVKTFAVAKNSINHLNFMINYKYLKILRQFQLKED